MSGEPKIKFIVDSPSDIPDEYLEKYDIHMVGVPINIDGTEYIERETITIPEFYPILQSANGLPKTSRVPVGAFLDAYAKAYAEGCEDAVVVTMNSGGSGTYESAWLAIDLFYSDYPDAKDKFSVHLTDSKTYSMAYGYAVMRAAAMAREGADIKRVSAYLDDFFNRVEIHLVCYSLEYARKSGRITAAAAFAGDLLDLRPVIAMIDGETNVIAKAFGNNKVTDKLLEIYRERRDDTSVPILAVGTAEEQGLYVKSQIEKELGKEMPVYKLGAAITINSGPNAIGLAFIGKKRAK